MPLGPLVRVPAFVTACVVVFCLAFVAADADANHTNESLGSDSSNCKWHDGHDENGSEGNADGQLWLLRMQTLWNCQRQHDWYKRMTGVLAPASPGRSLADIYNRLGGDVFVKLSDIDAALKNATGGEHLADVQSKLAEIETWMDGGNSGTGWLENIYNSVQPLNNKLAAIHTDLDEIEAAIVAQGPNGGGGGGGSVCTNPELGCPTGEDDDPVYVKYSSSEGQIDAAANAGLGALWFLAGLLVVVASAGSIRRAVMPR